LIPAGYMAKRIQPRPEWLTAPQVVDVRSLSGCISENFADYISYWRHNGYWLFDSPEIIRSVAAEDSVSLLGTCFFYYEAHEMEFDGNGWVSFSPESSLHTEVLVPRQKLLNGYDVVTFFARSSPECSPLSCNGLAEHIRTNQHCLFGSFADAETSLNKGDFRNSEPGPYRIFAVYALE